MMEGMSSQSLAELRVLAGSWMSAPTVSDTNGCTSQGYDRAQRAYVLTAHDPTISLRMNASESSPIANLCFVIKNWQKSDSASLKINGEIRNPGPDFRQGIIRDTDGTRTMVIWIKYESTSVVHIQMD